MNKYQAVAAAGVAGVLLSAATIIGMAASRTDGYSHLTKAVSELGSTDAPHRTVFNLLGYILPGLLLAAFFYGLGRYIAPRQLKWPFVVLAASGLLMALAGAFPMDMAHRTSLGSVLHTAGALGSGLAWLLGAFTMGRHLRPHPGWASLVRPLMLLVWLAVVLILLVPVLSPGTPALGQRVSFAAYFLFVLLLAFRLLDQVSSKKPALPW
jgi:hypothetical membrane protein